MLNCKKTISVKIIVLQNCKNQESRESRTSKINLLAKPPKSSPINPINIITKVPPSKTIGESGGTGLPSNLDKSCETASNYVPPK